MLVEDIAAVCHEANREYCRAIGDNSQLSWEQSPYSVKQSAIAGVYFVLNDPAASAAQQHDKWVSTRIDDGWTYGPELDREHKKHPCIVAYDDLPIEQRAKDRLFKSIVTALTQGDMHVR